MIEISQNNPTKNMNQRSPRLFIPLIIVASTVALGALNGCPTTAETNIEQAQFALDHCNPASSTADTACQQAVDDANAVLATDPTNVEAGILASSGYLGLAGVDFLQFAAKLVALQSGSTNDFKQVQTLVSDVESTNSRTIDLVQLQSSKTVLVTAMAGQSSGTPLNDRGFFQLGIIQAIDGFVRPIKSISTDSSGNIDASNITDATADILKQNYINSDSNLSTSGTTDDKTLKATREGYCRCKLSLFGYGAACVRDLVKCELQSSTPTGTEQDYNNDGTCGTAASPGKKASGATCGTAGGGTDDCAALRSPSGLVACKASNTE